jgi:hypothetical protein
MSLISELLAKPPELTRASAYTVINGFIYLAAGVLFIIWPGAAQALFRESAFVGHEEGLFRVIGLTLAVIGWLYFFGGRSGSRQVIAASVIDRLLFVPAVLIPLAIAGVFTHVFVTLAILDPLLATGAWILLDRRT